MLRRLLLAACAVVTLVRAAPPAKDFRSVIEDYYEDYRALYPIEAAVYGDNDPRFDAVWPNDISAEHRARLAALAERTLAALSAFDRASLAPSDQLSLDALRWQLRERLAEARQIGWMLPVNQFGCPTLTFAQMASGAFVHPFRTPQDFRNFLGRARGFSAWVDTAIANMQEGVRRGVVQPRVLMERVLAQLEPLCADDPANNILFGALQKIPADLPAAERAALRADYENGIRTLALPAYVRLHRFIHDDYLPHCRTTAGIGALPGGAEAYAQAVRWQTTTDLSPEEIHQLGLREVARIRGEMEKVRQRVGFAGTLPEFLHFVATDPKFSPYRADEEILDAYRAIEGRIMAAVPRFFGRLPRSKFEVRATEKFRAAAASAEYQPGPADGSRPGVFFVPIVDPAKFNVVRMENLFLHEAIPGHHFQISLAIENTGLPRFRRYDAANNAFVEGWALYCESLGTDLGLYQDPYQYLGMLLGDMHRAIRLVVDTGLHAKGWTREQALAYGAENEGGTPEAQIPEIERYMAWPGQALGYKIGQLKIRELRTLGEQQRGAAFDLRGFHDLVIGEGALPLAVLDARVRAWLAQ